ncbi:peptide/nickel transport system permease protein [Curtobacterium sp. PhB25]|jgi:peptide/nickel transport system permease protein|uniref:ABC transporter permease n=1 Tax=unclassified Curtobacterium TaxID=257496 RepID=UPI001044AE66|nr:MULTISPECIES: ABC transporter permease [unclassified Curtobacterium]MBF4604083.1 ABC transporter permease [Curtobacterium sp. VKM Ac-2884]QSB22364.1 ABC transporter permease [Curtobacterium sp. 24E2]TCU84290.1 peptide/nickel transport system permease protein [Curtobacterium sp. PhB191]TDW74457.1 peptide/nickel transport system permease protein [Curtobacterium sp. PhB25]
MTTKNTPSDVLVPVLRRVGIAVLTVVLASLFVFLAVQALPGDVAQQLLGQNATPDAVKQLRETLGLDQNVWLRYLQWLGGAVHGDFGTSLVSGEAVAPTLFTAFRNSMLIAVPAMLVGVTVSLTLGVLAGVRRGRPSDKVISIVSLVVMSVPEFMVATVLVLLFAIGLPVFPAVVLRGSDATVGELLPTIWLPIIVLTLAMAAYIVRTARSSTIDVMASEFVTTAELKGLTMRRVVWKHAVPSALLPTLNVVALNVAWLLGGVVVVENVFNYPGMGKLMLESVFNRDLPTIEAIALLSAVIYVVCNLAADLVALALDPKLRTRQRRPRTRTRTTRSTRKAAA